MSFVFSGTQDFTDEQGKEQEKMWIWTMYSYTEVLMLDSKRKKPFIIDASS